MYSTVKNAALAVALMMAAFSVSHAATADFDDQLSQIQHAWARANYDIADGRARKAAFERLTEQAAAFAAEYPDRAEALVWEGIVLSTYAGVKGGLGALSLAKRARDRLHSAESIDPTVLDGSVYTSLGTLYDKVPGGLIGFGDDEKAKQYLEKALELNPRGIDPNYFYAEYLYEHGNAAEARIYLDRAAEAPPRPNREDADEGRRRDIDALRARLDDR